MKVIPLRIQQSFRTKVLSSFLFFIIILLVWIAVYLFISHQQKQLQHFSNNLSEVQHQFLESNQHLQSFILSGFHEPGFYTNHKQKDIDTFLSNQKENISTLSQIVKDAETNHLNLDKQLKTLIGLHHRLADSAFMLKQLYLAKGFKDFGTEGQMRKYAHELEAGKLVPIFNLLMLRRHEKDYLIRGEASYIAEYNLLANKLIARYRKGSASEITLNRYKTNFNRLVAYNSRSGVMNNQGVYKDVQKIINDLGNRYTLARSETATKTERLQTDFKVVLIIISLLLILVVIWLSLFLSKILTQDIKQLNNRVYAFINSRFKEEENEYSLSFVTSTTEIGELDAHFLLLKKSLKLTIGDLEKSNLDLKTHSENLQSLNVELQTQSKKLRLQADELYLKTVDLKCLNEQLEEERKKADLANQAKSTFLATMSHEIRTPMNGVLGMASLLAGTELDQEQRNYLELIHTSGDALLSVINDILDFSKIESGNLELEAQDFDLRQCIENMLDVFANKAAQQGLDLVYQIDHLIPMMIIGDSLRLRQILINLVSNAIKFTHKGEVFIEVKLLQETGRDFEIGFAVHDTGIGIPEDKLSRLFKAFSQVDSSTTRKYGGTGLGLIISKRLVNLMGGEVSVSSKVGEGTTFSFTIWARAGKTSNKQYKVLNSFNQEDKSVLVVDDNQTNLTILENQLKHWKLKPRLASSGKSALAIMEREVFDLIITDMQMPEMNGIELAKAIKIKHPAIPIILLSSVGDESKSKFPELFNAVLIKPIKQAQLQQVVQMELKKTGEKIQVTEITKNTVLSEDFARSYPLNILVAEDYAINQKLATGVLTKLGYRPQVANNGKEAVNMCRRNFYHVILMDIQMPEMDGIEATGCIRAIHNPNQPVIIAMTAGVMQEDKEACYQAGMDGFLSKPFKLEALIEILKDSAEIISKKKKQESTIWA